MWILVFQQEIKKHKKFRIGSKLFTKEEAKEFISKPFMDEAVELRRFDDLAKILDKKTPDVEHFRPYLEDARKSFLANKS